MGWPFQLALRGDGDGTRSGLLERPVLRASGGMGISSMSTGAAAACACCVRRPRERLARSSL